MLYVSLHEFPAYPGTGWMTETGGGAGAGFTLNVPWPTGTSGSSYRHVTDRVLSPVLNQFEPDWLLVSAGYDAHRADPLAGLGLVASDYEYMAGRLAEVVPSGRIAVFLEGGYDLEALHDSAAATVRGLAAGPATSTSRHLNRVPPGSSPTASPGSPPVTGTFDARLRLRAVR